jgi:integrase
MMASIDKRPNGKWRARWREYPGGPQKTKHFTRKIDAEQFLDGIRGDLARGVYVDPAGGKVTFREYAEAWRQAQVHREGTAKSAEQQLRLHVYPVLGDRRLYSIRPSDVQTLVRQLSDRLAPGTVGLVYGRIAAVFNSAVRDRLIATTPCVDVKRPSLAPASTLEVLTTEQILALASAVPARYRALVVAGAGTGIRPGELFGLTLDRVDFLRRTLKVDQQLVRTRGRGVALGPLKTRSSYRTVPLASAVTDELAAHLSRWPAEPTSLMFTNEFGGPIQQHPFAALWETARTRAGAPMWATPHDLRHYYASLLIRSGASVKVVQSRLGHSSAKTTLDTYGHLFPDEEDRTRSAVDAEFARVDEGPSSDVDAATSAVVPP